jgi:hypothetical protein
VSGGTAPHILTFGTREVSAVRFAPRLPCPRVKSPVAVGLEAEGNPDQVERRKFLASTRIRIPNSRLCSHYTD